MACRGGEPATGGLQSAFWRSSSSCQRAYSCSHGFPGAVERGKRFADLGVVLLVESLGGDCLLEAAGLFLRFEDGRLHPLEFPLLVPREPRALARLGLSICGARP